MWFRRNERECYSATSREIGSRVTGKLLGGPPQGGGDSWVGWEWPRGDETVVDSRDAVGAAGAAVGDPDEVAMKKLLSEQRPRQVLVTGSLGKSPIAKVLRQHEATLEVTYLNSASTLATPLSRFTSLSQGDVLVISDMEDVTYASRHGMAVLLEVLCERWYYIYVQYSR